MVNTKRTLYLSYEEIKKGVKLCIKNVKQLISDCEVLCNNNGNETTAVSLYTIALEEFGKASLLQKCLNEKPQRKGIPVSLDLFQGVNGHYLKIEEAMDLLPEECQIYQKVDLDTEAHKLPSGYKHFGRDNPKMHEAIRELQSKNVHVSYSLGHFHLPFDFETRKNLLYVNWDPENKRWNEDVTIEEYEIIETDWGHEKEVEKNYEELYPDILLIAIDSLRSEINSNFNF